MKFILIYTICSFIDGSCLPDTEYPKTFDTWKECIITGLDTTKKVIEFFPPEDIENYRLGPRFVCQDINTV